MAASNKQKRNRPFAGIVAALQRHCKLQAALQRIHDFSCFFPIFCYGCHQWIVDNEAALEFLFREPSRIEL